MARATYEILEDDKTYYGEIPGVQGVWANEASLELCREELESALEDWLLYGLHNGLPIPVLDGINLNQQQEQMA